MAAKFSGSVITIGELVVDWIATTKGASWSQSETFLRSAGGNAANVAHALSRLGTKVRLLAKLGNDIHASYLLSALQEAGVDTTFISVTSAYSTAQCYVLTDSRDENQFFNWPNVNACHQLTIDDLSDNLFDGCVALHATGISLTVEPRSDAVIEALKRGRERGLLISFDAGFPTGEGAKAKRLIYEAMALSHVVKVNCMELFYWLGNVEPTEDLDELKNLGRQLRQKTGAEIILLTLGASGSIVITASGCYFAPPIKVDTLAGVGAGDAYVAAVLNRLVCSHLEDVAGLSEHDSNWQLLLEKSDWQEIASFANAAGALATRTVSASSGLASLSEVEALLAAQKR
jgi:fructokinase